MEDDLAGLLNHVRACIDLARVFANKALKNDRDAMFAYYNGGHAVYCEMERMVLNILHATNPTKYPKLDSKEEKSLDDLMTMRQFEAHIIAKNKQHIQN